MMTPSQTIGPFFAHALVPHIFVVPEGTPGAFWLGGTVFDGAGEPVPDALIETWQAEGWGRCLTDAEGRWVVHTVTPAGSGFIAVSVFARGLLRRLVTRIPTSAIASLGAERSAPEEATGFDIVLRGENETTFYEY